MSLFYVYTFAVLTLSLSLCFIMIATSSIQVKEVFEKKDLLLFLDKINSTVRQYATVDVTIKCIMTFRMFPYDSQDCFYEMVAMDRTQVEYLKMTTSLVEFETWPRQFSPTASEFEYEVKAI